MNITQRVQDVLSRLGSYPIWEVLVEFAIIWAVVYLAVRFLRGSRAAGALRALLLILVVVTLLVRVLASGDSFGRLVLLWDRVLALVAVALIVIFQPELRRGLIRLGEASFFRNNQTEQAEIAGEIAQACVYLAKARFGAIIVVERVVGLKGLTEGGTVLNAELSARLLQTIFYPGSALHDLAVIVRGKRVHAAGVQLPMASAGDMPDPTFGSRHRAAVGLTSETDALVVVVSEESGYIRFAERGVLSDPIDPADLEISIAQRLGSDPGEFTPPEPAEDAEPVDPAEEVAA
ncbi:MAG: diadenylate cyclase [Phycisphaerales bacterium JB040]